MVQCQLKSFLDFVGKATIVVFNTGADLNPVTSKLSEAGLPSPAKHTIIVDRVTSRLMSGLGGASLSRHIQHFSIQGQHASRVRNVAEVFMRVIPLLKTLHNVETLEELERFQHRPYSKTRSEPSHICKIREEILPQLPIEPGVYRMYGKSGELLYVGKANSLLHRVRSYYAGIPSKDYWGKKLIRSVHHLNWTCTRTELSALLMELRLRKKHVPPFNRADKRTHEQRFSGASIIRLTHASNNSSIQVVRETCRDGSRYYGPFSSTKQATAIIKAFEAVYHRESRSGRKMLGQPWGMQVCPLPEEGFFHAEAFFRSSDTTLEEELAEMMKSAAMRGHYEQAAHTRDIILQLQSLERKKFVTEIPVHERTGMLLREGPEMIEVHRIHWGLHQGDAVINKNQPQPVLRSLMSGHIAGLFDSVRKDPPGKQTLLEYQEMRILASWLHRHQNDSEVILLSRGEGALQSFEKDVFRRLEDWES